MEKPAAIFSEAAFKMLLEALTGNKIQNPFEGLEMAQINEVDSLVREYKEFKTKGERSEKLDVVADAVEGILLASGLTKSGEIRNQLSEYGFEYEGKNMSALMRGVMLRKPHIKKVGAGYYDIEVISHE
jgi:hypothetical protein